MVSDPLGLRDVEASPHCTALCEGVEVGVGVDLSDSFGIQSLVNPKLGSKANVGKVEGSLFPVRSIKSLKPVS